LKIILPYDKFEELMRLAYNDDMAHSFNDDEDSENAVHEEGLNEMITGFFGDENYNTPRPNPNCKCKFKCT
jgi:hypothetical protein